MQRYGPRHYFPNFIRVALPVFGIMGGLILSLPLAAMLGVVWGPVIGFGLGILYALGMAMFFGWLASMRKLLTSFQDAKGLHSWSYLDVTGSYNELYRLCAESLAAICMQDSVREYGRAGLLVGETKCNLISWGSEVFLLVEYLGPNATRVQVFSRPLIPTNFIDFGSNKRIVSDLAGKLSAHYTALVA
ncbi:MAG: hypothetical protein ABI670_21965 [Chloroflexota bacterium]